MLRALLMAALLAGPAATLVPIQAASAAIAADNTKCADTPQKKARRSLFGGIASGMLGGMLGGSGVGSVAIAALPAQGGIVEISEHCNVFLYYWPKTADVNCF